MARFGRKFSGKRAIPALLAAAGLIAIAVPGVSLAIGGPPRPAAAPAVIAGLPFTPARVDPGLALKVAQIMGSDGLRFTPATKALRARDRTVTVAVRVDEATARAISVRKPIEALGDQNRAGALALVATRYNLGIARGYQSFVQPSREPIVAEGLRDVPMPDLATFRPDVEAKGKPSRFQSRIAVQQAARAGKSEGTYTSLGEQSLDVGGSFRLTRNLDVTAGVRLSQERDRLKPLTDGIDDDQAVYVGTQVKF